MADKETPKTTPSRGSRIPVVVNYNGPLTVWVDYDERLDGDDVPCARFVDIDIPRAGPELDANVRAVAEEIGEDTAEVKTALDEITRQLAIQYAWDVGNANASEAAEMRAWGSRTRG